MKCVKCGAELKEGCIYCSVCGNEAQIVPDYSVLEDDYLRSLLKEEEKAEAEKRASQNAPKEKKQTQAPKQQMDNRIPIFVVCGVLVVAIFIGIIIKVVIDRKNANSYEYQVSAAEQEYVDKNYENALHYYKTALALKPSDVPVRLAMADIYVEQAEYDAAMVLLMEVIDLEPQNQTAYKRLIQIYEKKEDYGSIIELASGVEDTDILELFEGYLVAAPIISPVEGEYDEYIDVTLFSIEDYDIYYTLDGTEPDKENGIRYTSNGTSDKKDITLDEAGKYTVRAVCINEKGISSEIAEATYNIEVVAPAYATVSPDGGRITSETTVTVEAEENCTIYYTWDGTDPTEASLKYLEPLEIPTGNNILSILVVNDKTGLDSGVYRTNFIYYP
ncbi:MAG: chitobiase/beta-hexosaminidase C-terminal domain-containing protein [Clostridiales bacterium]|nr:chitobiase/beta-hexosaminidase C-terminal domain-containing protein [Roseburia sp.]MDD7638225.1 chitobiase/beta-hexosaminidase C-terminal domain-containing protein [Clostridiales bacterium]MDY4114033.1 chitobiase/beta-hexosaminidase C-terminal domain-containing protein [Roseburia sp.]